MAYKPEGDARTIPEWPGFDPERHGYIAATGGGDGWTVEEYQDEGESLDTVLRHDIEGAEAEVELWEDWINLLYVVEYDDEGEYWRNVADFDPRAFEWHEEVR